MRKTNVDRRARTPMRQHLLYSRQAASRGRIVEIVRFTNTLAYIPLIFDIPR